MYLQLPSGEIVLTAARSPERFLVLADPLIQNACLRAGGRNFWGEPHFRMVWAKSRFEIAGFMDVEQLDGEGKVVDHFTGEIAQLKYEMPEGMEDGWVLEAWRPAEWYEAQGRGDRAVKWHEHGLPITIQQFQNIPVRGDYEAVEFGPGFPVPFFHRFTWLMRQSEVLRRLIPFEAPPMTPRMVERQILKYRASVDLYATEAGRKTAWLAKCNRMLQRLAERHDLYEEMAQEAMGPYWLNPHSGAGGKTRDIGSMATTDPGLNKAGLNRQEVQ